MSYQVFARKYRPQTFDDVVGQEHITRTLKNAITQNRLAHAYLFVGPRGTGKTSTARILAKALCCVQAPTTEPCGVCDACKEIAAGISLDVLEIDGASNNGVEQVRELRDNVRYAPTRGLYKIYIIDEVHMLTTGAFNALLKTLEEPPEHVKFIFATTEPQKVLPTILSRCQRFDLRRIPGLLVAAHLQKISGLEKIDLAGDAADAIARGADGGLRDAESMLDQLVAFCGDKIGLGDVLGIFGFTAPQTVAQLADGILRGQTAEALAVLDAQSEGGKDLLRLMAELIGHFRNLLVYQVNAASAETEAGKEQRQTFQAQADAISTERLLELIDQFAAAEGRMKWAPNKKLHFEIALIKAVQTLGQSTLTEVIDALTALREGAPANDANDATAPARSARREAAVPAPAPAAREPKLAPSPKPADTPPETAAPPPATPAVREEAPPKPTPAPATAAADPAAPLDGPRVWSELLREIRAQRPLITAWVKLGRLLAVEQDVFRVGFPTTEKIVVESLNKPTNRKLLESLLTKFSGRSVTLKLDLTDEEPTTAAEFPPAPTARTGAAPAPAPAPAPAAPKPAAAASAEEAAAGEDPIESFKRDPKIQEALQIFDGEIRAVRNGNANGNGSAA